MIKKMLLGIVAVGSLLTSCSNDIDLIDTKREIPVVYGMLSRQDTAHYIRIERAFADNDISAVELARNIDSLYYKDITVQLIRLKDNKAYALAQVDGNKEGYKRLSGNFIESPNYLYKIKSKDIELFENEVYKLEIRKKDGSIITQAQTIVLPDMQLNESRTLIGAPLKLSVVSSFRVNWSASDVETSKMYDVKMLFRINEIPKDGSASKIVDLTWDMAKSFVPNPNTGEVSPGALSVEFRQNESRAFFDFLARNLDASKPAIRKLEYVQFRVDSGGQELYNYIDVGNVNLGITGTEVLPTYSNVANGYGILSSRNHFTTRPILLTERSMDSLINGTITKKFGFIN